LICFAATALIAKSAAASRVAIAAAEAASCAARL
jgi:hypothetical protein